MTTPKSPEQIMEEFEMEVSWDGNRVWTIKWLRSSMSSLLCYMAERGPTDSGLNAPSNIQSWELGVNDFRNLLIEEARKITNNE